MAKKKATKKPDWMSAEQSAFARYKARAMFMQQNGYGPFAAASFAHEVGFKAGLRAMRRHLKAAEKGSR